MTLRPFILSSFPLLRPLNRLRLAVGSGLIWVARDEGSLSSVPGDGKTRRELGSLRPSVATMASCNYLRSTATTPESETHRRAALLLPTPEAPKPPQASRHCQARPRIAFEGLNVQNFQTGDLKNMSRSPAHRLYQGSRLHCWCTGPNGHGRTLRRFDPSTLRGRRP